MAKILVVCSFRPEVHGPHEWFSPEHSTAVPPAVQCPGRTEPAPVHAPSVNLVGVDFELAQIRAAVRRGPSAAGNPDAENALRVAAQLRAAIEPAVYLRGPEGCVNGDLFCDDLVGSDGEPTGVEVCSHTTQMVATADAVLRLGWIRHYVSSVDGGSSLEDVRDALDWVRRYASDDDVEL